ncbi:HYC_CC_PP family protein [Pedobacter foliorum]|uniref:HYC_CC_PP family protein n=1 Tax=Pedobacter foliorum TaxID=2739058 RepID=UPI0015634AEC|nr:hypothetical protein [Pedobacter foliorum]NRF40105.1 hypothetical protein [Pedobacter foliorum]
MKRNRSIPLKAVFLLVVFLLNTVVGFACTVGLEENHDHHLHNASVANPHKHNHEEAEHHHDGLAADHHSAKKDKENCCKDEVAKLLKEDKLAAAKSAVNLQPMVFITVPVSFYQFDTLALLRSAPSIRYFVRSYHPPIGDIRISIQSFQI